MFVLYVLIAIGVVAIDQITKLIVVNNMELEESVPVIKGIFNFTYIRNEGAAFGILSDSRWVFLILSTIGIIVLSYVLYKMRKESKLFCIPLALIIGGGIGNMIDRIVLKYVIDFIDFCAFPKIWSYIYNFADACVVVGVVLLVVKLVYDIIKESKNGKNNTQSPN